MTQNDVKRSQATKLYNAIGRPTNYLLRLSRRMNELSFPPDDPLLVLARKAYHAVHELWLHLHVMSCSGAYGPPRPPEDEPPKKPEG